MNVCDFLKLKPGEITQYLQEINFKADWNPMLTGVRSDKVDRKCKIDKKLYRHEFRGVNIRYTQDHRCRIEISTLNERVIAAILLDENSLQVVRRSYGFFGNPNLNIVQGKNTSFWSKKTGKWRWEK